MHEIIANIKSLVRSNNDSQYITVGICVCMYVCICVYANLWVFGVGVYRVKYVCVCIYTYGN